MSDAHKLPITKIVVTTRHPEDYLLVNLREGSRWHLKEGRWKLTRPEPPAEDDPPTPLGGDEHHFEITVRHWGHGYNWDSTLLPQEVRAFSLPEALRRAADLPLGAWFPEHKEES